MCTVRKASWRPKHKAVLSPTPQSHLPTSAQPRFRIGRRTQNPLIASVMKRAFSTTTSLCQHARDSNMATSSSCSAAMGDIDEEKMQRGYYHRILGVSASATKDQIRGAYHAKLFEVHPDHGGSAAMFLEVREAFQALTAAPNLFALTRNFCDAVWGSQWARVVVLWEDLILRLDGSDVRFGALFFDDVLYACNQRSDYDLLVKCVHDAEKSHLFESAEARNVAYDSLLWHLVEGNRLNKSGCDIHLVYDCLHEMHTRKIPLMEDGWYIAYGYES
eukprot:jgi/Bigna1/72168/fgenesh1_pg.18_\